MRTTFVPLTTDRLLLRPLEPGDAPAIAAYRDRPEVARFQGWDTPYPLERASALVAEMASITPGEPGVWFQLAIADASDHLIGDCGFCFRADEPRICEIGFTVHPDHQGQGLGREAVGALLGWLFLERGTHRVVAYADADNTASRRVLEANGFRREGHLAASTWSKGQWRDEVLYGLLGDQWKARRAGDVEWHDDLHPGDAELLDDRIYEFNVAATGYGDGRGYTGLVRDERGKVIAGVVGWTWGGSAWVSTLWVEEHRRATGLGQSLLAAAEACARRRGCTSITLGSHSFQAPEFYRRLGYHEVCSVPDKPTGHREVYLQKRLDP